jgi:probable HAF family extracellular repeat protein
VNQFLANRLQRTIGIALAGAAAVAVAPATARAATVTWLGAHDGLSGGPSAAFGVSPDGRTVVGTATTATPHANRAFSWTAAGGMVKLPSIGEGTASGTTNGAGVVTGYEAFMPSDVWGRYWVNNTGGDYIGPTPGGTSGTAYSFGLSDDGSVIVGRCFGGSTVGQVALRWTAATGPVALPHLSADRKYSSAYAISGDGATTVGTSRGDDGNDAPVRWIGAAGAAQSLGDLPGGGVGGLANGVSPDGSVIVGASRSADSGTYSEAFRWTAAGGMQALGLLGRESSYATDVSADGSVIVGATTHFGDGWAFVWTESAGMLDLAAYLADNGVDVGTWQFEVAHAVSNDGRTIVGVGRPSPGANEQAFVVVVPEPAGTLACVVGVLCLLPRCRRPRASVTPAA